MDRMQIGVTVSGFRVVDGILNYELNVKFIAADGRTGEIGGTIPFTSTPAQAKVEVSQWILDAYGIQVPANVIVRTVGI